KIRNPRGRLEKLGVKTGMAVMLVGDFEPEFPAEIAAAGVSAPVAEAPIDLVFFAADDFPDLACLPDLRRLLAPAGAIWVVSPTGKGAALKDTDVMAAARECGLVDTKVVAFSPTHTALRLSIPKASRQRLAATSPRRS